MAGHQQRSPDGEKERFIHPVPAPGGCEPGGLRGGHPRAAHAGWDRPPPHQQVTMPGSGAAADPRLCWFLPLHLEQPCRMAILEMTPILVFRSSTCLCVWQGVHHAPARGPLLRAAGAAALHQRRPRAGQRPRRASPLHLRPSRQADLAPCRLIRPIQCRLLDTGQRTTSFSAAAEGAEGLGPPFPLFGV